VTAVDPLRLERFLDTLEVVKREGDHLCFSYGRVFDEPVNEERIGQLEQSPEDAERLEAFVSRFGRMQDTIGNKLLPRWLRAQAEEPGTLIEVLNRGERLGVVESAEDWLVARELRNRLVHEYMKDPAAFAEDLRTAGGYAEMLHRTYNHVRGFAARRMQIPAERLPPELDTQ